jgi:ribosome biogenesis protein Nip4
MINKFIEQFTGQHLNNVVKVGKCYYQAQPELKELMDTIAHKTKRTAYSVGLFLGEEKGKDFRPSLALIDIIGHASERWVMVDEKAEWLFLCGRDIFAGSVIKANVPSGLVLVVSRNMEVLGYGKITGRIDNLDRMFVKNILDKGDYLRREMSKKKHN